MQARRNLYESANVKFDPTTTLFKSVRQESYFRWKATEVQKVMDRMNYRNLLQHDRENIDKLKSRRFVSKDFLYNEFNSKAIEFSISAI